MPAKLKYHHAIFDMLDLDPTVSEQRLATLADREKLCGTRFPESVREWFSLEGVEEIFHENSGEHHLCLLHELGDPAETAQGYLRVAWENQAVVRWFVRLNEGEDPPVYDDQDEIDDDLSTVPWELTSASFTNFIFDMVSSCYFQGWYAGRCLSAKEAFPDEQALRYLRLYFREGPRTDTPDIRVFRFFSTDAKVVIRGGPDASTASSMAEWELEASSSVELYRLTKIVWSIGTLSRTLEPDGNERQRAQAILDRVRNECSPR